jgi:hypothetical protein
MNAPDLKQSVRLIDRPSGIETQASAFGFWIVASAGCVMAYGFHFVILQKNRIKGSAQSAAVMIGREMVFIKKPDK